MAVRPVQGMRTHLDLRGSIDFVSPARFRAERVRLESNASTTGPADRTTLTVVARLGEIRKLARASNPHASLVRKLASEPDAATAELVLAAPENLRRRIAASLPEGVTDPHVLLVHAKFTSAVFDMGSYEPERLGILARPL